MSQLCVLWILAAAQPGVGELTLPAALSEALESGPEARMARLALDSAIAKARGERPALRPDLTLLGTGGAMLPTIRDPAAPNAAVRRTFESRLAFTARQTIYHAGASALGRRSDAAVAGAVADHAATTAQLRHEVALAYLDALAARAGAAVAAEGVADAQAQVQRVADLLAVEKVAEADELQAKAGLLEAQAAQVSADTGLELALANLNRLLGRSDQGAIVALVELPELPRALPPLELAAAYSCEHRPEVASLKARIAEAEAGADFARSERLPTLALTGTVAAQTAAAFRPAAEAGVGFEVNLPISRENDEAGRRLRAARAGAEQAALALEALRAGVALEVRRAVREEASARQRYGLANARVEAAAEACRVKLLQYERRRCTLLETQDAALAVSRAKLARAQARYDVHRAVADFELATAREMEAW